MALRTLLRNGLAALMAGGANTVLRHDATTREALARLDGRIIALHITPPDEHWFCMPGQHGIQVLSAVDTPPDITISGSLPALLLLAMHISRGETALHNSNVDIRGDHELLHDVMRTVRSLDIDWEALLARATGDVIAHQVGRAARSTGKWADSARIELARQLTGYLQEELHILPTRSEVAGFCNDVDQLSLATERLQARVQQALHKQQASHNTTTGIDT